MVVFVIIVFSVVGLALLAWAIASIYIPQHKEKERKEREEYLARIEKATAVYNEQIGTATEAAQQISTEQHYIAASEWER